MIAWAPSVMLVLTCGLVALGSVFVLAALQQRADPQNGTIFLDRIGGTCFLFDQDILLDATPQARALLSQGATSGTAQQRLLAYLLPRFPGVETQLAQLEEEGAIQITAAQPDGSWLTLEAELRGGITRLSLQQSESASLTGGQDLLIQSSIRSELGQVRQVLHAMPLLVWRESAEGEITWANGQYLDMLIHRLPAGEDLAWPLPPLFDAVPPGQDTIRQRRKLTQNDGATRWFEVSVTEAGDTRLHFAQPVDALVQAETALSEFTQTLTKTFAHLPIGLAVFDRQRQLALFNPALLDLCELPIDFLSSRPTLFAFLDAMRSRSMIPEPKDYRSWRKQMADLEQAAASGMYEETWSLPSGQTYRLTGRPHPNGALALMFEDISTEVSRIRRYRADLELGQSVLDAVDSAIAVFGAGNRLVMANSQYSTLWDHDPGGTLDAGSLAAIADHWRQNSAPNPFWAEVAEFCDSARQGDTLMGEVRLLDGRLVHCRVLKLPAEATMIRFDTALRGEARHEPYYADAHLQLEFDALLKRA
ncbi:PAS-domain containing protein [Gemmobacter serpentinus]|uniref:PAS-domain containing protein n=1 Tax=Gemmobacter serpentinus TaxID=2652247 RepID=UPI00124C73B0|nr:PAS-domain containing protein [Gemmobacter serpentinus]